MRTLEMVLMTLGLLACTFLSYDIGRMEGHKEAYYVTKQANPLYTAEPAVWDTLARAASRLYNCHTFRVRYPKAYATFRARALHGKYTLGYDPYLEERWTAHIDPKSGVIYLGPAFFEEEPLAQERTLAHEMLHLSGLPPHSRRLNLATDPIYTLVSACYPDYPYPLEEPHAPTSR